MQARHRFFQHLLIKLDAHFTNIARLFFAQEVATAAHIEVMAGQLEASAETIQRLQDFQALFRALRNRPFCRNRQIGIGAGLGPTNAAAQLIHLRKAKHIRPPGNQRVGAGNIQATFHNRGGDQHIINAFIEGRHDWLHLGRAHLTMRHRIGHFRHHFFHEALNVFQMLNTRGDKEGLAATIFLTQQGFADGDRVPRRHISAHGQAVDRRCSNDRHFADASQRQLQGARDRRGRQSQHMGIGAQFFQALFVLHAKMLLFIDDHKAQVTDR